MYNEDKPYWYPELTDEKWCQRVRDDYNIPQSVTDKKIRDKYANGQKYAVLWDNLEEAYDQFEKLADAYLKLLKEKGH
jgi:hypothetical protein